MDIPAVAFAGLLPAFFSRRKATFDERRAV
jgi:hypothetical protein